MTVDKITSLILVLVLAAGAVLLWRSCPAPPAPSAPRQVRQEARENATTELEQLELEVRDVGDSDLVDALNRALRGAHP